MRLLVPLITLLAILSACDSTATLDARAHSKPQLVDSFGKLAICAELEHLPKGAHLIRRHPNDKKAGNVCAPIDHTSCEFQLNDDPKVIYVAELGRIREKTYILGNTPGPFALHRGEDVDVVRSKVAKQFGQMIPIDDAEGGRFLQSDEVPCPGDAYRLIIGLDHNDQAEQVILSALPSI